MTCRSSKLAVICVKIPFHNQMTSNTTSTGLTRSRFITASLMCGSTTQLVKMAVIPSYTGFTAKLTGGASTLSLRQRGDKQSSSPFVDEQVPSSSKWLWYLKTKKSQPSWCVGLPQLNDDHMFPGDVLGCQFSSTSRDFRSWSLRIQLCSSKLAVIGLKL